MSQQLTVFHVGFFQRLGYFCLLFRHSPPHQHCPFLQLPILIRQVTGSNTQSSIYYMNTVQIQTAQNVFIEYQPAGVGDRLLANLIDKLIKGAYFIVVMTIFGYTTTLFENNNLLNRFDLIAILWVVMLLPLAVYTLVLEIVMDGQTIGKRAMQIKVVRLDGAQPTLGNHVTRWLMRIIDIYFPPVCSLIGNGLVAMIAVATNPKGQRLGDMAAGTTVITLKRRITLAHTRMPETDAQYKPMYPQVIRLTDRDVEIIRETLQTAQRNNDPFLLSSLATKLKTLLEVNANQANEEFLQTILKDYTHIMSNQ